MAATQSRMILYGDERVNRLLSRMLERGLRSLEPRVGPDGRVEYGLLEDIIEPERAQALLDGLAEVGILRREVAETLLACPDHNSPIFSAHLSCRKCGSSRLRRRLVLEHPVCGCVAEDNRFLKGEQMACPKCGRAVGPSTLRPKGGWYECEPCGAKQEQPQLELICLKGGHGLKVGQALGVDIYRYLLTPEAEHEFRGGFLLSSVLQRILAGRGLAVEVGAHVTGLSGVTHTLDLVVQTANGGRALIKTYVGEQPLDEKGVLNVFLLYYDLKPEIMVLAAMPGATEGAARLAQRYGLRLVAGSDAQSIAQQFTQEVLPLIEGVASTR